VIERALWHRRVAVAYVGEYPLRVGRLKITQPYMTASGLKLRLPAPLIPRYRRGRQFTRLVHEIHALDEAS
jgi:hypothetical protein